MSTRNVAAAAATNVEQVSPVDDDSESEMPLSVDDAENASFLEGGSDYESGVYPMFLCIASLHVFLCLKMFFWIPRIQDERERRATN
jgi:hypothetical protein